MVVARGDPLQIQCRPSFQCSDCSPVPTSRAEYVGPSSSITCIKQASILPCQRDRIVTGPCIMRLFACRSWLVVHLTSSTDSLESRSRAAATSDSS